LVQCFTVNHIQPMVELIRQIEAVEQQPTLLQDRLSDLAGG
jgi:hypothetical protein